MTPKKKKSASPSSSSSSSIKFRDMQDLLDSLSGPNETLLIVFTATNCGPCKLQKQELSEFRQRLSNEHEQSYHQRDGYDDDDEERHAVTQPSDVPLKMLAIDTEKWPHVGLAWFKVSKLPCVVVLRNKQVVARMEGLTRAKDLLEHVRPHLLP
jgi:thiol-disulfide isomerase/thioredoxin